MKLPAFCLAAVLICGPVVALADQLQDTYQSLQDAVAKKDPAQVKKLVTDLAPLLKEALAVPAPQSDEEKAGWKAAIEYAQSIQTYTEYALYLTATGAPPATFVDLISMLEKQNPKSQYLDGAYAYYFVALNQTGGGAKIPAIAEKAVENFPNNLDLLLLLTENTFGKGQTDRALGYALRLPPAASRPKPETASDADWNRKKALALQRGYFVAGVVYGQKNDYNNADKNLRAALPLIQGNNAMMAPALFYLGIANYQLGKLFLNKAKVLEGAKFSDQCATIPSNYAEQASKNAAVSKRDALSMR